MRKFAGAIMAQMLVPVCLAGQYVAQGPNNPSGGTVVWDSSSSAYGSVGGGTEPPRVRASISCVQDP